MTMDKVNRLGDTNIEEDANVEDNSSDAVAVKPVISPSSKNWSYPSLSPANASLHQNWSHSDIVCSAEPDNNSESDRNALDDYDASIELSNNCRKFYFTHMKTAAEVRKSVSRAKKNKAPNEKNEATKRSSIDLAMDRLRREMAELMDQDLSLMEQLLTLNDKIEEVKYNYMYSVSKDSLYASSCDLSTSCDLDKSRHLRSCDESDNEVFDLEIDEDFAEFKPNEPFDKEILPATRNDDSLAHVHVPTIHVGIQRNTTQSLETISVASNVQTGKRLCESITARNGNTSDTRTVSTGRAIINTHTADNQQTDTHAEKSLDVKNPEHADIQGECDYDSGSESIDHNDDTLTDSEDNADDDVIDDDDILFLMSTGESNSSGFVSGIDMDDVFEG